MPHISTVFVGASLSREFSRLGGGREMPAADD
jgi:hypothetical protein